MTVEIDETTVEVSVTEQENLVITTNSTPTIIEVGIEGPQGPRGVPGGSFNYTHTQGVPASTWTIEHNLGDFPNVTIVDSANTQVEGDVTYIDADTVQVEFQSAFSGKAYLS